MKEMEKNISYLRSALPSVCALNHSKYIYDKRLGKMVIVHDKEKQNKCTVCTVPVSKPVPMALPETVPTPETVPIPMASPVTVPMTASPPIPSTPPTT
jgi:hypothetical protein